MPRPDRPVSAGLAFVRAGRRASASAGLAAVGAGPVALRAGLGSARAGLASVLALVALSPLPAPAAAQDAPLVLEARGGAAVPLGSFADGSRPGEGAETGASFGVRFVVPGAPLGLYAGFSQHRFRCQRAGCASGGAYVATGFGVGVRAGFRAGPLVPWLSLGTLTTRVETGDLAGPNAGVSEHAFGAEAGAGVFVGAGSAVALNPSLRLAAVNTRLPGGPLLRMRYLVAELALALAF